MNILVFHNNTNILGWLIGEKIETAENHINNGYQHLRAGYAAGTVLATVVDVPESDIYRAYLYHIANGTVIKIEG